VSGTVAVLIPVKAFGAAKGRLAEVLDGQARADLARSMATIVVAAAAPLPVTVVCDDDDVDAWTTRFAFSEDPFAVAVSDWYDGIERWNYGLSTEDYLQPFAAAFYTDRGIYRPGQTVYWKGIIRDVTGDGYRLPAQELAIDVLVRDDRGNVIHEETVTPNEHGTVNGQVALTEEATAGAYYLETRIHTGKTEPVMGGTSFQVASYRKPEFEISVTPVEPAYVQGEIDLGDMRSNFIDAFTKIWVGDAENWR